MIDSFDYFVLFAEMRTGSNHVEESLNAFGDLHSYGEMFNAAFMGHHNLTELHGYTMAMREADPLPLLDLMVEHTRGLPGFRFFHDHDPRVLEPLLKNPRCAKIILTRNPLDSYVSLKIARETGQWRLVNEKRRKTAQVAFDGAEFDEMSANTQAFHARIQRALQTTGQSAFYLRYEDIVDLEVINGLGAWLGAALPLDALPVRLKKQNPMSLSEKLSNYDEMEAHVAQQDPFALSDMPAPEPKRGAGVPGFVAAATSPLLHIPVPGGPSRRVSAWMEALDGAASQTGFSQKTLRPWMRRAGAFTAFSVVRHPLVRAYHLFNTCILPKRSSQAEFRQVLIEQHGLPIPPDGPTMGYDAEAHRVAFQAFLEIVKKTLNGATSLRFDPAWGSQVVALQSAAQVLVPHRVIREPDLVDALREISAALGRACPPLEPDPEAFFPLAEIHTRALEDIAMDAYRRDYLTLGFKRWDRS